MSTITTDCTNCRSRIWLVPGEVLLRTDAGRGRLAYLCRKCETVAATPVTADDQRRLVAIGVTPEHGTRRPARSAAAALTLDDLLDFHELLATPGWFDVLLSLLAHEGRRAEQVRS